MRQDERRDLSRVPPNRPGRVPPHEVRRDASTIFGLLRSALVGAFRRPMSTCRVLAGYLIRWRKWLLVLMWLLGLVVQVVLVWLAGLLVDLSLSLMELWVELARKHLEIVLSES